MPGIAARFLWRSVAILIVFAQVAAAAELCLPDRVSDHAFLGAVADADHGLASHCTGNAVPADQAPASEAKQPAPDVGAPMRTGWDLASSARALHTTHALPRAGPSLRLQYRNLRL